MVSSLPRHGSGARYITGHSSAPTLTPEGPDTKFVSPASKCGRSPKLGSVPSRMAISTAPLTNNQIEHRVEGLGQLRIEWSRRPACFALGGRQHTKSRRLRRRRWRRTPAGRRRGEAGRAAGWGFRRCGGCCGPPVQSKRRDRRGRRWDRVGGICVVT